MLRVPALQFRAVETLATTRRYWNLEGAHIPSIMYPTYPSAMPVGRRVTDTKSCDGARSGIVMLYPNSARIFKYERGSDHFLRLMLEERLNSHVVARYPKDVHFVEGEELPNGKLTGALADMASGLAQLGLNLRIVRTLPTPEILYLQPIHEFSHVGIAVARAPLAPLHVAIMRSFDLKVWFSVAGCYILSAVVWSLLTTRIHYESVLQEIQKFILIGCGNSAQSSSQKFFASACAIFSLIIVTIFQLAAEGSPVMTELCKHMKTVDKHYLSEPVFERKQALIISDAGFDQLTNHYPTDAKLLHMVKDTFIVLQRAYTAHVECPVKEQVEKILWYLTESGIRNHWDKQASRAEFTHCSLPEETPKPFSLKQFKIAFYTLCLGLLFSSIVFLLEVTNYKRCQKVCTLQ
ncbi:uncharacterized protein LOC126419102 [Schistocerca serialis cubense]|uniref:uncharacterized protein LOC126419102 n=1 Tax=Schistocerca serialis cubense TaxID=2023355 RepID=UPI00214F325E|nr:uncharacterized protein LOC126419102 [Schistocerca serialis cubense]